MRKRPICNAIANAFAAAIAVAGGLLLSGCAARFDEIGRAPAMSPVGQGMRVQTASIIAPPRAKVRPANYSLWPEGKESMFHDQRARAPGDVITVLIQINDQATLDNFTRRSRKAGVKGGLSADFNLESKMTDTPVSKSFTTKGSLGADTNSTFNGKGSIGRAEKINLAIAAVITRVLPNGNFVISGSQEVRVNNEMRVLRVAGIVRPEDISQNNSVRYDRIAEARISYGGRGRISEVQQPGWGQQILDLINPL